VDDRVQGWGGDSTEKGGDELSDWEDKKQSTREAIDALKPGQTFNAFQGKTSEAPVSTKIYPAKRWDMKIDTDLETWLGGLKERGIDWSWANVISSMTPSIIGGVGRYDVTTPDGSVYQLQDMKYAGKRRTPDQIMPTDLMVVLKYRE